MMKMSQSMKGGGKGAGGGGGPPDMSPESMSSFLDNPEMTKAAEDMMKNMSPEMMASMAKSSGVEMSEGQAQMMGKMAPSLPYIMKCMRMCGSIKRAFKTIF